MISRRSLLGGAAALAASSLAGCSTSTPTTSKFRTYIGPPVTGLVVSKGARRLYLLNGNKALKAFYIQMGSNPVGHKRLEGDGRTPEGAYIIGRRNPNSQYYLSVGISYPNVQDLAYAQALGAPPGGHIFIHGTPPEKLRTKDWTAGCIAVTNDEVAEIYAMVRDGTPITISA
jgi:murein L,D-transpeptidase YafK